MRVIGELYSSRYNGRLRLSIYEKSKFRVALYFCWSQSWYLLSMWSLGLTFVHSPWQKILYESFPYFPMPYSSIGCFQSLDRYSSVNLIKVMALAWLRPHGLSISEIFF